METQVGKLFYVYWQTKINVKCTVCINTHTYKINMSILFIPVKKACQTKLLFKLILVRIKLSNT